MPENHVDQSELLLKTNRPCIPLAVFECYLIKCFFWATTQPTLSHTPSTTLFAHLLRSVESHGARGTGVQFCLNWTLSLVVMVS